MASSFVTLLDYAKKRIHPTRNKLRAPGALALEGHENRSMKVRILVETNNKTAAA